MDEAGSKATIINYFLQQETSHGFVVESIGHGTPLFYNASVQTLTWCDETITYRADACLSYVPLLEVGVDTLVPSDKISTYSPVSASGFLISSTLAHGLERAAKTFARRLRRIVAHRITLNGKAWLVPAHIRNSTETNARDHAVHFEEISLTREHSSSGFCGSLTSTKPRSRSVWSRSLLDSFTRLLHTQFLCSPTNFGCVATAPTSSCC